MFIESDTGLVRDFSATLKPSRRAVPIPARKMYAHFVAWCVMNGVPEGLRPSEVSFGRQTTALGMRKHRGGAGTYYVGVELP